MPQEFTAEDIDKLFDNKYFQQALRRRFVRTPYTIVASVGALLGVGTVAVAFSLFNTKISDLNSHLVKAQTQIAQLTKDADAAKAQVEMAVANVQKEQSGLAQTSELVTGAVTLASSTINNTQNALRAQRLVLEGQLGDLQSLQTSNQTDQKRIELAQRAIERSDAKIIQDFEKIDSKSQLLDQAQQKSDQAIDAATQLQGKVNLLSSFKTFEMVTLRAKAGKLISLKQIQDVGSTPVDYTLDFRSHGLRTPVEVDLVAHRSGAKDEVLTYPQINPPDPVKDRWDTFCICGTPWMFQGENWVQSPWVRDFITLRVVGRDVSCKMPAGRLPETCTNGSTVE